jgi:hypothetical protein
LEQLLEQNITTVETVMAIMAKQKQTPQRR